MISRLANRELLYPLRGMELKFARPLGCPLKVTQAGFSLPSRILGGAAPSQN